MRKLTSWNKWFDRFTFFMAFPGIILLVNLSMYFFVGLYLISVQKYRKFARKIKTDIPIWAMLFGLGAAISTFRVPDGFGSGNFKNSITVLPNYIYWASLVVFLNRYRSIINYDNIRKLVFYGVTLYIPFWFLRENFFQGVAIFQKTAANNLAFLMISYSPMAISYVRSKTSLRYAIPYFIGILVLMLFLGRRAGFALVLITGLLTLFVSSVSFGSLFKYGLTFLSCWLVLKLPIVQGSIENANPRVYQLIYERDEMVAEDRSYLTRVAMFEKGMYLFGQHPISGVGLTNFHHSNAVISGNFEGSQYVINKDEINQLSAHNSYVSAISEGGIVLFIPWIFIMLSIIVRFAVNIQRIEPTYYPLFWGYLGMIFHYTSVVGYVNVYSWFIIAICGVVLSRLGEVHVNNLEPKGMN